MFVKKFSYLWIVFYVVSINDQQSALRIWKFVSPIKCIYDDEIAKV